MQRVTLIDNYDSFTFNLVHYLGELGADVKVWRNDEISVEDAVAEEPDAIVLSPGPCTPNEAGICLDLVRAASESTPIFGVCLGHQAIGQAFGGDVVRAPAPLHGKVSRITHNARGVFRGLNGPFQATRYHSLIIERSTAPAELEVSAETDDGLIMAVAHRRPPGLRRAVSPGEHRQRARPRHPAQFLGLGRRFSCAPAVPLGRPAADGSRSSP